MPIYDINDYRKSTQTEPKKGIKIDSKAFYSRFETIRKQTDQPGLGSKISTRLFFVFLLSLNALWIAYAIIACLIYNILNVVFFARVAFLKAKGLKTWVNLKRSAVCFIALIIAIFNPALGIMFSCLYFMMYDKMGIEEIVPPSLREQFKEFFP